MSWSKFRALLPYFGGKRVLCGAIFKAISLHIPRSQWSATTFVDGFFGGGATALYAKAQGMRVLTNDIADRGKIAADALIANDRVTIADADIHRLFIEQEQSPKLVEENFVPSMFMRKHAQFIDRAMHVVNNIRHETKQQLMRLLIMHYMLRITPYSQIHSVNYFQHLENEEFHRLGMSRVKKIQYTCMPAIRILKELQANINAAIFPNRHRNEAWQEDVFDFLQHAEGEVCYLDPPYAGAQPYEVFYQVLDQVLAGQLNGGGRVKQAKQVNPFNSSEAKTMLERLLDAARKFPIVILSYGSQRYPFEEFQETVRHVDPKAECLKVNLRYAIGRQSEQDSIKKELMAVIANK